jgi:DNA-binding MarR family transcriptional regulator
MENLLLQFISTLDTSLKTYQNQVDDGTGISKLTISQFQYINAINELQNSTITAIAEQLNITKASVTNGINKLVKMGYVLKTPSTEDKRVVHVTLTESSRKLVKAKSETLKGYGEFIHSALSEEETEQLKIILEKLVRHFDTYR